LKKGVCGCKVVETMAADTALIDIWRDAEE